MLLANQQRLARIGGLEHDVAVAAKDAARQGANLVVVLDEQNRLGAPTRFRHRAFPGSNLGLPFHPREVDLERRPFARLAVDPDVTAALLDDAEDGGKAETGSLASLLGREEGLEDPIEHLLVDPRSSVG